MGSKHAGIHLRCDDSSAVLEKLKKEFGGKKKGPDLKEMNDGENAVIVVHPRFVSI